MSKECLDYLATDMIFCTIIKILREIGRSKLDPRKNGEYNTDRYNESNIDDFLYEVYHKLSDDIKNELDPTVKDIMNKLYCKIKPQIYAFYSGILIHGGIDVGFQ